MKQTGDEYFDSQDFHDLLSEYEQAVEAGQSVFMDADELAEIADYYQMQGQMDEAEAAIRLALSLSPGAIAPLTYRIHEALYEGDVEAAKNYLAQITETDEPDYVYDQAEIMLAEGRVEDADLFLREKFRSVPPDEYQDYVVDVASIFSDYGANEKAMQWMARAKHEDTPDFKELMARTLFGLGKYKDSEKLFNELIDTDPFQKRYWNALASAQFMNEDYSNSIQSSEYAIAIDPSDPDGLFAKANGLYRLNNFKEALEYYRRYSKEVPDDETGYIYQGTCLLNIGRCQEAVEVLQQALDIAPPDSPQLPDIYQELSFAYSELGETDKAVACLDKTDNLDCDHSSLAIIKGHVLLAAKRPAEAERHFRDAICQSDDLPQTIMRIIVSLYDNKFIEAAYRMFLYYFEIVPPDHTEGYAYMALCCYDLKKHDEFLKYLKVACERNPRECRLILGNLFPRELEPEKYYEYVKKQMKK